MSQLSAYGLELADESMWMIWWVFDQEKDVDKAFKYLEEASCSQAVGLRNTSSCAG